MTVAIVTGCGQGIGRGIVEGLAEAGHTIFFTVRKEAQLEAVSRTIRELGGQPHPLLFDHSTTSGLDDLIDHIVKESGRIDLLVNNVWGGYENMEEEGQFTWDNPFWDQSEWRWDAMMTVGVKTAYLASSLVAPVMINQKSGVIVNLSYWAARKHISNVLYGMAKAATDKMSADIAVELKGTGVSALSIYPGLVRTEKVMKNSGFFDLSNSESPRYIGRVIAALQMCERLGDWSGKVCVAAEIGGLMGVTDVDGRIPKPMSLDDA